MEKRSNSRTVRRSGGEHLKYWKLIYSISCIISLKVIIELAKKCRKFVRRSDISLLLQRAKETGHI